MSSEDRTLDIGRRLADWLRDVNAGISSHRKFVPLPPGQTAELLRRAAQCYARDGWAGDACRLFVRLGDDRSAAPYFEQLGQWAQAGAAYARSGQWRHAARCWQRAGEPAEAAECLVQAGEPIEAAWLFAHSAVQTIRARNLLAQLPDDFEHDPLAAELVTARCDASTGKASRAARRLRAVADRLHAESEARFATRILDWAFVLANELRRPDLTAMLHAIAFQAGVPNARQHWEEWAASELGETVGVPEEDAAASMAATPTANTEQVDSPEPES